MEENNKEKAKKIFEKGRKTKKNKEVSDKADSTTSPAGINSPNPDGGLVDTGRKPTPFPGEEDPDLL